MGKNKKGANQAPKVEKVVTVTPEVKTPEVKVETPTVTPPKPVDKPRITSPKERIPIVKPQIVTENKDLSAKDAIKLAELNRDSISMGLLGDTPELGAVLRRNYAISLVVANVLFQEEIKVSGVDKRIGLILKDEDVNAFIAAVNDLGITGVKQLEVKPDDAQTAIDFTDAVVPEEVIESAAAEKKILEDPVPELDPTKITSEEDLVKAVKYTATRSYIGDSRKTGKPTSGASLLLDCMKLVSTYRLIHATDENTKKDITTKQVDYWVNEVFKLLITTETTQLPTKLYTMCKTIYSNASAFSSLIPAHAVLMKMSETTSMTDAMAAKIIPVLINHITKEWLANHKLSEEDLDKDLAQKAIANTTGLKVLKVLNRERLTAKSENLFLGSYRGAAGIFSSCYFTKEARELPTFLETFEKKFLEVAALYDAVPTDEDHIALEKLCKPVNDPKKN